MPAKSTDSGLDIEVAAKYYDRVIRSLFRRKFAVGRSLIVCSETLLYSLFDAGSRQSCEV